MKAIETPLDEIQFVRREVLDFGSHYQRFEATQDLDDETLEAIFVEAAKFFESEVAPLNRIGDEEGCRWNDGQVSAPPGYRESYQRYVENGWPTLDKPVEFGGQGFPESVGSVMSEMMGCANVSWTMYPGLSHGALKTIHAHGTQEQKDQFLPQLVSGKWTGTMCLTEPHCGSDLGLLRTRARPNTDGSFRIDGTKIFISAGEHDLSENIVHIVLARIEGAPSGTRGISLFIVPRDSVEPGGATRDNGVTCASIEKKMGIHGSATCVLNFDGARAYLLGPENKGLACMFTFMNAARLGTAQQGVVHAEVGYQKSLAYARERLQMRALSGPLEPELPADPIIVHADVRRMLLTQRAFAEAGRTFVAYCSQLLDIVRYSDNAEERSGADSRLSFLTPIAKAFLTEAGLEAANHALQCFGGHGYIREWGVEQNVRDARISTLYEGTTGIQALDLVARKVLADRGAVLREFVDEIRSYRPHEDCCDALQSSWGLLDGYCERWLVLSEELCESAGRDAEEIGAASVDYLMLSGYVVLGAFWIRMACAADRCLSNAEANQVFYRSKIEVCEFYMRRLLPRFDAHAAAIAAGAGSLHTADFLAARH